GLQLRIRIGRRGPGRGLGSDVARPPPCPARPTAPAGRSALGASGWPRPARGLAAAAGGIAASHGDPAFRAGGPAASPGSPRRPREQTLLSGERLAAGGVDVDIGELTRAGESAEVDDLVVTRAPAQALGVRSRRTLDEHLERPPDEALGALARPALHEVH